MNHNNDNVTLIEKIKHVFNRENKYQMMEPDACK